VTYPSVCVCVWGGSVGSTVISANPVTDTPCSACVGFFVRSVHVLHGGFQGSSMEDDVSDVSRKSL
jgi:hypothetical protein